MTAPTQVIVVTGPPGSGKSTTGREIARLVGAALLDQDSMTNPLVDVIGSLIDADGIDDPRLADLVRAPRYESLLRVAIDCVRSGTPVVLVAPFTAERRDERAWNTLHTRLSAAGGSPHLVWIRVSAAELLQRLRRRDAERDRAKLADTAGYLATVDLTPPVPSFIEVDGTAAAPLQARRVIAHLGIATTEN